MRVAVLWLCLVLVADAQDIWIERASPDMGSKFSVQIFRIDTSWWVLCLQVKLEEWLPYAFDTVISVSLRVQSEKGEAAETTFSLPARPIWEGSLGWYTSSISPGSMVALYLSCPEASEGPLYARALWPCICTPNWVETSTCVLRLPVKVRYRDVFVGQALPGDSIWSAIFVPADVDTTPPAPPYLLRPYRKRSKSVPSPCAWYLKGDSSRIFWTCRWPPANYASPGATLPPPSAEKWEVAFHRFSDIKSGERSDRGLIYLFYGTPPILLLTPVREVWVYPREGVSFHFFYEGGTWHLQRRLEYQSVWKK
ncbi:MAG: hypothetical protein N2170_05205 [Bacteroidia bacterium]|nr:hypothetical protein [Bacteroidia bacterium]